MGKFDTYSEKFLKGEVFINTSVGYVDLNENFWNKKLNDKTYQIYVHSLFFLKYLTESYKVSKSKVYLTEAENLLNRWLEINHKSKYIMHEHPVSSRVGNILRFSQEYYQDIPENIEKIVREHIEFLLDDKNYKKNNHGILMDTYLSSLFKFMPKELKDMESIVAEKVIIRTQEALDRDFSSKGLHLENSPDYHRLTVRWIKNIEKNLNLLDLSLGEKYLKKLSKAITLDSIISMPNHRYPINGDSSDGSFKGKKAYEDFVDIKAGRAVFQNNKSKSQVTFICGYGSRGHKHYDDLSFIFYVGNEVLLNDSGKYNYVTNDKIRQHVISPLAHNSLSVYRENYKISSSAKDKSRVKINSYSINKKYKIIKGTNNSYKNTSLVRTLVKLNDDTIILYDKFKTDIQKVIAVNFNLGLGVNVSRISRGTYVLNGKENYILKSHYGKFTGVILEDSNQTPCKISNSFNTFSNNQRILLRQKTKSGFFLTTLSKEENEIELIDFDNEVLTLISNGKQYVIRFE